MTKIIELTEVKPVAPFCGSYPCALDQADTIDDALVEKPDGTIVKEKQPRKRFVGLIEVTRYATAEETALIATGRELPEGIALAGNAQPDHVAKASMKGQSQAVRVVEYPKQRTVMVPTDIAAALVRRGLAELVEPVKPARRAA